MIDLEQIRKRVEAATEGPWQFFHGDLCCFEPHERQVLISGTGPLGHNLGVSDEDFQFIAHARTDIPALLAEVEHLNYLLRDRDACLAEVKDDLRREEGAGHEVRRKLEAEIVRLRKIEEAAKFWKSERGTIAKTPGEVVLLAALSPEPR